MMRVCIFVANNCTVDSRVLRQAKTFAGAGHETVIVAVHRGGVPAVERRDGFEIRRVPSMYTWRDAYPRLGWTGLPGLLDRLVARRHAAVDVVRDTDTHSAGEDLPEPLLDEIVIEPPARKISVADWGRWLRTGTEPAPRSWRGGAASVGDRVLFLIRFPLLVAVVLAKKGYRVTRRLFRRSKRLIKKALLLPTRFRQLDRRMAREAIAFDADLYWANDIATLRAAHAAASATGAPAVYDAHEVIWDAPTVSPRARKRWGRVEEQTIKKMGRVFTVCDPIAREMAKRYGIEEPTVVLNCPRLADTTKAPAKEDSPLNAYRKPGETIVLFHGSLSPWRGLEQLVGALQLLPPNFRLVVLGHGPFRDTLETLARKDDAHDRVTFIESVPPDELPAWLAGADVGTIPYQRHGLNHEYSTPNKLFEYMHLGIPIVVNELPEIRRIVTEVGFGIVCDCSDPAAIAKAIEQIVSDPVKYEQMRKNARAAAPEYSWERQESKILSALEVARR
jgi:glycosyltransferase involved in cell wall biosynthesis